MPFSFSSARAFSTIPSSSSSATHRCPRSGPPPGSHTLQDWRRCLAMFLTVNSLPQKLTANPPAHTLSAAPLSPTNPVRNRSHPATQHPPPHPTPPSAPPPTTTTPPCRPPPQLPSPQPCKTARDGRSSRRRCGHRIPHTPSARPPTSSPPHTSSGDRRGRPS